MTKCNQDINELKEKVEFYMQNMRFHKTLYVKGLLNLLGVDKEMVLNDANLLSVLNEALSRYDLKLEAEEE